MGLIKTSKPKRVLGIDCSSKSFAFALFDDGKLVHYGQVFFDTGDIFSRMHHANKQMQALSHILKDIDAVYFEAAVYIQNKQSVISISYVMGAALSPLLNDNTIVKQVPPITWQRIMNPALTKTEKETLAKENPDRSQSWLKALYRKEHKARGIAKAKELYGVAVESDDVSDAILVGGYGVKQWQ